MAHAADAACNIINLTMMIQAHSYDRSNAIIACDFNIDLNDEFRWFELIFQPDAKLQRSE